MKRKVLIDCHAGLRDALALAIARNSQDMEIAGVTECYSEVPLSSDLPVSALTRTLGIDAETAAGSTAPILPRPSGPQPRRSRDTLPADGYAWDLIYRKSLASDGLTILALGPLTNLAAALFRYEDLPRYISKVIIGAGSSTWGDVSAFAERSVYEDARACQAVLQSGIPVEMVGLNAAAQLSVKQDMLEQKLKTRNNKFSRELLAHYAGKAAGGEAILLSAAAAAVLADPAVAEMIHYHVVVETASSSMYGRTVVDWRLYEESPKETAVAVSMDAPRFRELLFDAIDTI